MQRVREHEVVIDKLVHGGQGIGSLENNKKALVWGVLPGERVRFRETKSRSDFVEGVVLEVMEPSPDRILPKDELYLSTSPWQIMSYKKENDYKKAILTETLQRAKVDYTRDIIFGAPEREWHYRNKMEYSFYGDDNGLHLALFNRGTHQKQIVKGSSLANSKIDGVAEKILTTLNNHKVRASDLKSIILRCGQGHAGEVVAAIFTRERKFSKIKELEGLCRGVVVVYSNPKSPASVRTKDLYQYGDISLSDTSVGTTISYDVFSFFQVNLPMFHKALGFIDSQVGASSVVDMYSGVGTIGLSLPFTKYVVESDEANIAWATKNARNHPTAQVIHATSESALNYINGKDTIILDPPRAGLHKNLVDQLLEQKPPKIIYLSCNPATQARDLAHLQTGYKITFIGGYNFFPRTPHIESLAVLVRE